MIILIVSWGTNCPQLDFSSVSRRNIFYVIAWIHRISQYSHYVRYCEKVFLFLFIPDSANLLILEQLYGEILVHYIVVLLFGNMILDLHLQIYE